MMTGKRSASLQSCSYDVDADLRIVAVNDGWTSFALANDAPELAAPHPLGKRLLEHIADPTMAHLYEQLLLKVRRTQRALTLPLRCDSPSLRRFLELRLEPLPPDGVRLTTSVLRVEPREPVHLLERHAGRNGPAVRMCSFCKRIEVRDEWREMEDAAPALGLLECDSAPPITHGICPTCYRSASKALDASPND